MKILAIAKTLERGGAATGANNMLNAIRGAGAEVVALDGYAAQRGRPIGSLRNLERIYERVVHDANTHCLRLGPPTFNLHKLYHIHKPDVIQLFDVSGNTIAFEALKDLPCPVVHRLSDFWPYHGARHYDVRSPLRPSCADRLLRWTHFDGTSQPDMLVAPSHWLADRIGRSEVQVIRNAVDPVPGIVSRRLKTERVRFGFISNPVHDPRKGLAVVPKVLGLVADQIGAVELHIFGKGSETGLPYTPGVQVIAHPAFERDVMRHVYSCFDILLCPSVLDNSPNVLTEALSHALPVVAQSGTGMDSYVTNAFGELVDFHSGIPTDTANVVEGLVARYVDASAAALRYAAEELAPNKIGNEYLTLYSELLSAR